MNISYIFYIDYNYFPCKRKNVTNNCDVNVKHHIEACSLISFASKYPKYGPLNNNAIIGFISNVVTPILPIWRDKCCYTFSTNLAR